MFRNTHERGQALVAVAAGITVAALLALVMIEVGGILVDRARAQTAADAAALAGAAAGELAAREMAQRNGAVVESYSKDGDDVQVEVRVGRARAVARAVSTAHHPVSVEGEAIPYTPDLCPPASTRCPIHPLPAPARE